MLKGLRSYGVFLIIPGIVSGFSLFLRAASGPFWLGTNLDPAYQYLVNGVYLAKGLVPNHADHPGTPLQLLCCGVAWILNPGRSPDELLARVFTSPEVYLHVVFILLTAAAFAASVALALYVHRKSKDTAAALLTQLPALGFLTLRSWPTGDPVIPVVANVSPEPLLMSLVSVFNFFILRQFFEPQVQKAYLPTALWGGVAGLAVAVKLNVLPLWAVPLMVLPWRHKALFLAAAVASFFLWTLPIVSKYPYLWQWASGLATHTGVHGSGVAGFVNIAVFCANFSGMMKAQGMYLLALLAALALAWHGWRMERQGSCAVFLAATALGVMLQFALVAKHPGAHYMLPGLALGGALFVFLYLEGVALYRRGRALTLVLVAAVTLVAAGQAAAYGFKAAGFTRDILAFHDRVRDKYQGCTILDFYRSSGQEAALFFGDGWRMDPVFGDELARLYPNRLFFHFWSGRIVGFHFTDRVFADDLLKSTACVVFYGQEDGFSRGPFTVRCAEKGPLENLYVLTAATEKEAVTAFYQARQYAQAGDYDRARERAFAARQLKYQPGFVLDNFISLLPSH